MGLNNNTVEIVIKLIIILIVNKSYMTVILFVTKIEDESVL